MKNEVSSSGRKEGSEKTKSETICSPELESFSNGSLRKMNVDLLAESSRPLERERERLSVHQDFSVKLSLVLPLRETVEESRLSGTCGKRYQHREDPTRSSSRTR